MKNKWLLAGILSALVSFSASAVPITGEIHLSGLGAVTLINNFGPAGAATPNNADEVAFPVGNNAFVSAALGSFAPAVGASASQNGFAFNPTLSPSPVAPLWTITSGALAGWTFSLDAITLVDQGTPGFLNLAGVGRFNDNVAGGFDETEGGWTFTVTSSGSLFTWTSSNASVPDGGMTVMLLGAALSGLGLIRRKLA